MMLSGHGGGANGGGRRLFTASQWQELEHQALIYKYMASGAPVPHDLVVPLRLATGVDTVPSLACFPPHPPAVAYWGCYGPAAQFGRKPEDPEPGRCRRTDGKKWRCSREAHGESKYCEKHVHRGKNRSRKPVEAAAAAITSPAAAYRPSALSISPPAPDDAPTSYGHQQQQQQVLHHHQHGSSARASPLQLHLDAGGGFHAPSPPPSYHRYAAMDATHGHGAPTPLCPSSYAAAWKAREDAEARRQHYLALGADLSLDKPAAADTAEKPPPMRRFFDEWPRESGGDGRSAPWMGAAAEDETQLSMSIPAAAQHHCDLASRYHHNGV